MGTNHRNTHTGTVYTKLRITHNLASFVLHFHFLAGVSGLVEAANLWNEIIGNLILEGIDCYLLAMCQRTHLLIQLTYSIDACTADSLICGNDHTLCICICMQRLQRNQCDNRCTVWIGNDAVMLTYCLRIHLRNNQRYLLIQTES